MHLHMPCSAEIVHGAVLRLAGRLMGTARANAQGNTMVVGRKSPYSLYDEKIASFEDDGGLYDQSDAAGFIKLQALRLRTLGANRDGST